MFDGSKILLLHFFTYTVYYTKGCHTLSSHFSCFSGNGISLCSGEVEMKTFQRSRQAHFLGASAALTT